jgi:hypothetical protein
MKELTMNNFTLLALTSAFAIIYGIIWWMWLKKLLDKCTAKTIGKIISSGKDDIDELWYVVAQFNVEGKPVLTKKISTVKRPPKIQDYSTGKKVMGVGQEVTVLYNPDNTSQYYVKGYSSTHRGPFLAILFGLALAVFLYIVYNSP